MPDKKKGTNGAGVNGSKSNPQRQQQPKTRSRSSAGVSTSSSTVRSCSGSSSRVKSTSLLQVNIAARKKQLHNVDKGGAGAVAVLRQEFKRIKAGKKTFDAFLERSNRSKNRFTNLILYDDTRVRLDVDDGTNGDDYIHASWVDGYDRNKQFILAQAPITEDHELLIWRLVYKTSPSMIVLLTRLKKDHVTELCSNFWPGVDKIKSYGPVEVRTLKFQAYDGYDAYDLRISSPSSDRLRVIRLFQYLAWTEDEAHIPLSLPGFAAKMRIEADTCDKAGRFPIMVMCPSGIHRSGTFVIFDIAVRQIQDSRKCGLEHIIKHVRSQRYGSVQMFEHYRQLYGFIIDFIINSGFVQANLLQHLL